MNNFKKIGLSALAGSLAMASAAYAADASVSMESQIVFSSAEGNQADPAKNGKGFGSDNDLTFNASGETDNGLTISIAHALDTNDNVTNSSTQFAVGMGSLGTFQFNQSGGASSNAIDDVLPKAYEETWDHGVGTAEFHSFGSAVNDGSVSYKTPSFEMPFGLTVSGAVDYDPNAGVVAPSPGAVGADAASGEAFVVKLAHESGLTLGGGNMTVENTDAAKGVEISTGYVSYANGGLSIAYQEHYENSSVVSKGTTDEGADIEADGYAVAYTAGDFTFSYSKTTETEQAVSDQKALEEEEFSAVQAAYNLGGMTIAASMYEADNLDGIAAAKYEETELSVSFAF